MSDKRPATPEECYYGRMRVGRDVCPFGAVGQLCCDLRTCPGDRTPTHPLTKAETASLPPSRLPADALARPEGSERCYACGGPVNRDPCPHLTAYGAVTRPVPGRSERCTLPRDRRCPDPWGERCGRACAILTALPWERPAEPADDLAKCQRAIERIHEARPDVCATLAGWLEALAAEYEEGDGRGE